MPVHIWRREKKSNRVEEEMKFVWGSAMEGKLSGCWGWAETRPRDGVVACCCRPEGTLPIDAGKKA